MVTKNTTASPDLSALAAWAGDNQDKLTTELYKKLMLEDEGITVIPNLKSKMTLHKLLVRKGVKPYTGVFKPKPDLYFQPRSLEVHKAQRDFAVEPSKYLQTFMEKRRGAGENSKNMTVPFADVMWNAVLDELKDELVTQTIYHGVGEAGFAAYASGTAYSVGAKIYYTQDSEVRYFEAIASTSAGQNPDTHPAKWEWAGAKALAVGFKGLLDAEETAGNLTPISTGAITSADAYDQITSVWRGLAERDKGGFIYMAQNSYEALLDDYEAKIKKAFEETDGITYLAKTNKKAILKPVEWLNGSGKIIASRPGNLWMGTDQTNDMNIIKVIEQMYHLDAGITFMIGFQIADIEALATNDQD